jgi:hypothetical protein
VREQVDRLKYTFQVNFVDELMTEFQNFEEKYHYDSGFKSIVDNTNDRTSSFQDN